MRLVYQRFGAAPERPGIGPFSSTEAAVPAVSGERGRKRAVVGEPRQLAREREHEVGARVRGRRLAPPVAQLARLAALVPEPRVNLTRYHGVFAPNSAHRAQVTKARRGKGGGAQAERGLIGRSKNSRGKYES